jgi:hemerythrin-like domain-containing protein
MPNAITMLKSDHATLKRLLRELNATTERAVKERQRLVNEIEREVKIHSQIEEEVFYPAFLTKAENTEAEDLFYEAAEEHHVVDMVLPALKAANPKSHEYSAKAKVLKELIEHHIKEEENEMFTKARQLFTDVQLRQLGDAMKVRRDAAQAMWDSTLLRPVKKMQSVAHKLMPTKVKTAKAKAIAKGIEAAEARR